MNQFNNKIIKILSSHEPPKKVCIMGNEAVARGAIEAGVRGVFAYPGTPSTEISEVFNHVSAFQNDPAQQKQNPELTADPIYFEYSPHALRNDGNTEAFKSVHPIGNPISHSTNSGFN